MNIIIDYEKLGNKIKAIRTNKNLTQEYLADAIGCNVSHISNIENNHTKVSLNVLFTIATTLDVTIDYLLSDQCVENAKSIDQEILNSIKNFSDEEKEQLLRIIHAL